MNNNYALITGSTAGIGLDIAQELASRGHNILLTARREDRLKDIAEQIVADFGVEAHYVVADLGEIDAPGKIFDFCTSNNYVVDILVNNAGYSINKKFHETDEAEEEKFLRVLGTGVIALTKRFIPSMLDHKSGKIMLVSSLAAFAPPATGWGALYGPVKTFINRFGDALNLNYRAHGITATNVCPGFTVTEFHTASGMQDAMDEVPSFMKKDSKTVAKGAVDAMLKGKTVWVPGLLNKLIAFLCNNLPTSLVIRMSSSLAGGRYE
ncbi:SDR family NAD(P)-dependent oxidoreductase [Gammaproteobacteria bacterium]|nr:SDR family NAD(P)-dependent oxidoreductase [bacterium]MDC0091918.1 SDR family NAD(P)-dependent oxidoreductase [Gammaproteobacteria bacterium]|tara:strand:- start:5919 stop:6716 length:798 start_codon:yes stop_codon:yes gene_type:complete